MRDIKFKAGCLSGVFIVLSLVWAGGFVYAQNQQENAPVFAKDRFIVKFKGLEECPDCLMEKGAKLQDAKAKKFSSLHALNKKHGVQKMKSVFFEEQGLDVAAARKKQKESEEKTKTFFSKRTQRGSGESLPDLSSIFMLEVADGADIEKIVEDYRMDSNVEYAQPDYMAQSNSTFNDPLLYDLWGLQMMQTPLAWDLTQGEGVVVAVVDTGVDYNHQDLAANIWMNPGETLNGLDDDGNGFADDIRGWNFSGNNNEIMDINGHGTHVAGTIAAVGNNGMGIAGIAPGAKVMPVKGLADNGTGSMSQLAAAIRYAALKGADVINNSWGCSCRTPVNSIVEDAVRFAHGLGAGVVFSAGDNNDDAAYYSPQNMKETLTVAASDAGGNKSALSNYGAIIDVTAPGVNILSTYPGDRYVSLSGTSMAAAHVSGLAALILAEHPTFLQEDVRQAIRATADDLNMPGFDINSGHGRVNALAAVSLNSVLRSMIASPINNSFLDLNAGDFFPVKGTVSGGGLRDYTLDYKLSGSTDAWTLAHGPMFQSVDNNVLGTVATGGLADGTYLVRVNSVSLDGHEFDDVIQLRAMHEAPFIKRLTTETYHQMQPDIAGDWMVWSDAGLALYNIQAGEKRLLGGATSFDIIEGKVFYSQYQKVLIYDIATGQAQEIPMAPHTYLHELSASPSGDKFAWRSTLDGDSEIYLYDMATAQVQKITDDPGYDVKPRITGDFVFWQSYYDPVACCVSTIQRFNMATGEKTVFLPKACQMPAFGDGKVLWQDYGGTSPLDFILYDVATGTSQRFPGLTDRSNNYIVAVSENKIAWKELLSSSETQLFQYDLITHAKKQVTVFPVTRNFLNAYKDRLVWDEWRDGNYDIFLYNPPESLARCGDSIVQPERGEVCDSDSASCLTSANYAGTQVCNAQCSGFDSCVSAEFCGDGILNGKEQCDGLAGVGLHQECSASCTLINLPYCGDGIVNGSEQCDGLDGVGLHQECSASCLVVNLPYCGDGIINGSEQCDGTAGVGEHQECTNACLLTNLPYCGDGIVNGIEQCDGVAGIGSYQECSVDCTLVNLPYCGDGIVNGTEQCDGTAGVGEHQECSSSCTLIKLPYCGDGIKNGTEACDLSSQSCKTADGYSGTQSCNTQCSGFDNCVSTERCGDGIVNGSEQCDGTAGIGLHQECSMTCTLIDLPYCGDNIVNGSEQCDGLAGVGLHQECSSSCTLVNLPYCGDGVKNGLEECDGIAGVGEHQECSSSCTLVTLPSDPEFVVLTQSHTVYTGSNVTFNVVAQDANGYNLDLQVLEALPKNAVFSSDSTTFNADGTSSVDGTFNWTPSSRQTGTYTLHFEAGDTSGTASVVSDPVTIKVVKPTTTKTRR